jgi:4-oxalocrotonate tautomerase
VLTIKCCGNQSVPFLITYILKEKVMPFVNVKLAGSVSKEQKKEIAKEITETLQKHAHKPPSYTYVVFEEVKMEDWAIGGSLLG